MSPPLVEIHNLSFCYTGTGSSALRSVCLTIGRKAIHGLVGPNGAGKTTLMSILATLLKPAAGSLRISGIDPAKRPSEARLKIGFVPQEVALYPELSGRENLRYFGTLYGLDRKTLGRTLDAYLDLFGLTDAADARVSTYSGGMKRRLNLLSGILHSPELLLCDEPTVGIDAQSRTRILETLILLKNQGMTVVYATHYMEEVSRLCSMMSILDSGVLVASGQPDRLVDETPGCTNLSGLYLSLTGKSLRG